jgi:hypothetical protein
MAIRSKIPSLEKISIIPHSSSDITDTATRTSIYKPTLRTKINALRNIKMKKETNNI